ncbi:hypothetical protein [Ferrovum myxofaciens]|jgi:hypothetical protein|uniref:Uncharacterized protein n=1 Tax=Ferrovum myxofaciens TaxID=416213 RepID=A0A9E6SXZ5_9PROT|nr:hypothetical protein [Ferrovum myxofaciens]QKE37574.1 MAG: hypothetical protein HO273_01500 [Ferrovum myxofaciens]QWY75229.1 MAG: hypothetical protein JVY19_01930 [Ferrovum myxofaciens]QWY77963.1 MAG: hypothetical protein JZL65_02430 [Ferrovum myxofaciens]
MGQNRFAIDAVYEKVINIFGRSAESKLRPTIEMKQECQPVPADEGLRQEISDLRSELIDFKLMVGKEKVYQARLFCNYRLRTIAKKHAHQPYLDRSDRKWMMEAKSLVEYFSKCEDADAKEACAILMPYLPAAKRTYPQTEPDQT